MKMENLISSINNNLNGFSENILRNAYENIFNDSGNFYSLLYNQFIDKNIESNKSYQVLVRPNHVKTQTIKTVILADDDEDDRLFFKEALQELQVKTKIILLKDGAELMDHLTGTGRPLPHIIFLDLNLPKKNGIECLAEMRKNDLLKNIPIAIYSTSSSEEDIQETYLNGASIYIKKPNDFSLIKKMLKEVISINWDSRIRNTDTYFINPS